MTSATTTYGTAITAGATFDVTPEPSDLDGALVGATWNAKMVVPSAALIDWTKALSLNVLCGSIADRMGSLGTVSADTGTAASTTECLSFDWNYDNAAADNMRCYYCNGKDGGSNTVNEVYFSAFATPVR